MSYQESIIIPLDVFKKCNFSQQDLEEHSTPSDCAGKTKTVTTTTKSQILNDDALPPDVKIKLFNQKKRLDKQPAKKPQEVTVKRELPAPPSNVDFILSHFSFKLKPTVYILLKYIQDSKGIISWNDNLELELDGKTVPESDLISLLRFVTGSLTITSAEDIPKGGEEFANALDNIGVPKTYIKLPRRSARQPSSSKGWVKW